MSQLEGMAEVTQGSTVGESTSKLTPVEALGPCWLLVGDKSFLAHGPLRKVAPNTGVGLSE